MTLGIIWDLDGTLYDFYLPSKRALYVTWEKAYFEGLVDKQKSQDLFKKQKGEPLWELKFWESLYNVKEQEQFTDISKAFLKRVIEKAWPLVSRETTIDLAHEWWVSFFNSIHLQPWVLPLFERLTSFNVPIGLLSNSPKGIGEAKLQKLALTGYFTCENTIWAYDYGKPKPSVAPFQALCNRLDLTSQKTLVIGDNFQTDILGAKAAGMKYHLYKQGEEIKMMKKIKRCLIKEL